MTIVSRYALIEMLFDYGIPSHCISTPDERYVLPSYDWLLSDFRDELVRFENTFLGRYTEGCTDCDDFAFAAHFCAMWMHRWTPDRPDGTDIAVAEFVYCKTPTLGHAITLAGVADSPFAPGKLTPVFLEPQPNAFGPLHISPAQRETCSSVRF